MSTTLDPTRLRWLLQRLHSDFPGVEYATLVRSVMQVEQTSDLNETLDGYLARVREVVKTCPEASQQENVLRSAKIVLQRTVEPHLV